MFAFLMLYSDLYIFLYFINLEYQYILDADSYFIQIHTVL